MNQGEPYWVNIPEDTFVDQKILNELRQINKQLIKIEDKIMAQSAAFQALATQVQALLTAYQNEVGQVATNAAAVQEDADDNTAAATLTQQIQTALNPTPVAPVAPSAPSGS